MIYREKATIGRGWEKKCVRMVTDVTPTRKKVNEYLWKKKKFFSSFLSPPFVAFTTMLYHLKNYSTCGNPQTIFFFFHLACHDQVHTMLPALCVQRKSGKKWVNTWIRKGRLKSSRSFTRLSHYSNTVIKRNRLGGQWTIFPKDQSIMKIGLFYFHFRSLFFLAQRI